MLSVILFVLRIILWILLILLGLLLAILVAVLFGAIRYRADGTFQQGKFQGKIKICLLYASLEVSQKAIALKTEIEKVREQIQNIE